MHTKTHLQFNKAGFQEFSVRSSSGWKGVLDQIRNPQPGKESQLHRVACHVVTSCKNDIRWLWNDSVTQKILHNQDLRLEDSPGLYVDNFHSFAITA
jgi:guanine nucleotide-binding protein subunit alpha